MNVVAGIIMIAGAALAMIGGIGIIRFGDLMSRVHAAAKAPTLGLLLVALGAAIEIGSSSAIATLVLVVVLQLATSPVATHVLARASYGQVDSMLDGVDDLAVHLRELASEAPDEVPDDVPFDVVGDEPDDVPFDVPDEGREDAPDEGVPDDVPADGVPGDELAGESER